MTKEEKKRCISEFINIQRFRLKEYEIDELYEIVSNVWEYNGKQVKCKPKSKKAPLNRYMAIEYTTVTIIVEPHNLHIAIESLTDYDDCGGTPSTHRTNNVREFLTEYHRYFKRW